MAPEEHVRFLVKSTFGKDSRTLAATLMKVTSRKEGMAQQTSFSMSQSYEVSGTPRSWSETEHPPSERRLRNLVALNRGPRVRSMEIWLGRAPR